MLSGQQTQPFSSMFPRQARLGLSALLLLAPEKTAAREVVDVGTDGLATSRTDWMEDGYDEHSPSAPAADAEGPGEENNRHPSSASLASSAFSQMHGIPNFSTPADPVSNTRPVWEDKLRSARFEGEWMAYVVSTTSMEEQLLGSVTVDELWKLQILKRKFQLQFPGLLLNFGAYRLGLNVLNFDTDNNYRLSNEEFARFFEHQLQLYRAQLLISSSPSNTTEMLNTSALAKINNTSMTDDAAFCFSQFDTDQIPVAELVAAACLQQFPADPTAAKITNATAGDPSSTLETGISRTKWSLSDYNPFSTCSFPSVASCGENLCGGIRECVGSRVLGAAEWQRHNEEVDRENARRKKEEERDERFREETRRNEIGRIAREKDSEKRERMKKAYINRYGEPQPREEPHWDVVREVARNGKEQNPQQRRTMQALNVFRNHEQSQNGLWPFSRDTETEK
ncbi:unnamed protein product [Amoebophrya sp. A120]|nr:unnamed protein product [Amoebophrya sp. A120]|eukprot:GSA120T00022132001.1